MENQKPLLSLLLVAIGLVVASAMFAQFHHIGYSVFCVGFALLAFGEYARRRLAFLIVRCTNEILHQRVTKEEREALLPDLLDKLLVD